MNSSLTEYEYVLDIRLGTEYQLFAQLYLV